MEAIKKAQLYGLQVDPGVHNINHLPGGFTFQETPGHGYLILSEDLMINIPPECRSTKYSRHGRYEEDCDWAIPVCFHLQLFDRKTQEQAILALYDWNPRIFEKRFSKKPVESWILQEKLYKQANENMFVPATAWGSWADSVPHGFVGVRAIRQADKKEIYVLIPENEYKARNMPGFTETDFQCWRDTHYAAVD